jgi:hypothetical protein
MSLGVEAPEALAAKPRNVALSLTASPRNVALSVGGAGMLKPSEGSETASAEQNNPTLTERSGFSAPWSICALS